MKNKILKVFSEYHCRLKLAQGDTGSHTLSEHENIYESLILSEFVDISINFFNILEIYDFVFDSHF